MVRKSELSKKTIVTVEVLLPVNIYSPTLNEFFARSASCSNPNGDTKGDLELSAAAIVRAGSKQRNKVAVNKNLPR
jgi:hypothetical protein